ncbi:MAG: DUF1835 domain-containing protein [Bacteroidetes bacterium]|nr:MAG: DUF1835 domain-containing protein [Bacteroidota bacterium]
MPKKYQILNGDSLAQSFSETNIEGEIVVVREGLIDGDLSGATLDEFWKSRAAFHDATIEEYRSIVVSEFQKLENAPADSEFNLWFEYDLFCQVNMWFIIWFLNRIPVSKKVYAVYTNHLQEGDKNFWNGFGPAGINELKTCYSKKILLSESDLQLGENLWKNYKEQNLNELIALSEKKSSSFPYLKEVIRAHVERFPQDESLGRPEKVLSEIIENNPADFQEVFREFWKRESIYGFGDLQLKHLYDKLINALRKE